MYQLVPQKQQESTETYNRATNTTNDRRKSAKEHIVIEYHRNQKDSKDIHNGKATNTTIGYRGERQIPQETIAKLQQSTNNYSAPPKPERE